MFTFPRQWQWKTRKNFIIHFGAIFVFFSTERARFKHRKSGTSLGWEKKKTVKDEYARAASAIFVCSFLLVNIWKEGSCFLFLLHLLWSRPQTDWQQTANRKANGSNFSIRRNYLQFGSLFCMRVFQLDSGFWSLPLYVLTLLYLINKRGWKVCCLSSLLCKKLDSFGTFQSNLK